MRYLRLIYYLLFKGTFIHPRTVIGHNVYIGYNCIIGHKPEHKSFWNHSQKFKVVIKDNTVITGACTIDAGTVKDTVIGEGCFIMKQTHIGHDAIVGDNVIISPHATIGGHCVLGDNVKFGMNSVVHQRVKVPNNCIIGMGAVITKKTEMWEGGVYVGNPAGFLRATDEK